MHPDISMAGAGAGLADSKFRSASRPGNSMKRPWQANGASLTKPLKEGCWKKSTSENPSQRYAKTESVRTAFKQIPNPRRTTLCFRIRIFSTPPIPPFPIAFSLEHGLISRRNAHTDSAYYIPCPTANRRGFFKDKCPRAQAEERLRFFFVNS